MIHYVVEGQGTPCIVLHGGLGLDQTLYRATLGPLARHFQLVYMDQRCNGLSERVPIETLTMENLSNDVIALADHLGFGKFFVLGHSYGGNVALELMCRNPERLSGAILVGTTCGYLGTNEEPYEHLEAKPPVELDAIWDVSPKTDAESQAQWGASLPYFTNADSVDVLRAAMANTIYSADALVQSDKIFWDWSVVDRSLNVEVRTLVIHGERDLIWDPVHAKRIARALPNATLAILEGANHFPWIETPEAFFQAVKKWVATLEPPLVPSH